MAAGGIANTLLSHFAVSLFLSLFLTRYVKRIRHLLRIDYLRSLEELFGVMHVML